MAKGKTYGSKFAAFRVKVRSEAINVHPNTGVIVSKTPALVAEFAEHGAETEYMDENGLPQRAPDIRGHYFDSGSAQDRFRWSDEERETVEAILDQWCERWPEAIWQHSKPKAKKPWPKYDETHHNQIPTLAETLGLVAEALAYEQENKNRDSVVEKLAELVKVAAETEEAEGSLTAA